MRWRRGHSEGDKEQPAKFSGAEIFKSLGVEVGPEKVADMTDLEYATEAQLLAERHPTWPSIELRIHFSGHGKPEDHRGVPEHMKNPGTRPDIYLYEETSGSLEDIASWQAVADIQGRSVEGTLRANPKVVGSISEPRLRGLLGSEIAVGSIDLRQVSVDEATLRSALKQSFGYDVHEDFEQSLQKLDQATKTRASDQRRREAIMIQRLEPEIARLIAQRPELGTKDKLNIYMTLGAVHTTLFRDLEQAGFEVDRTFPENPYVYSYLNELERTYKFGAEARLNVKRKNKLLARAFLERVFIDEGLKVESYDDRVLVGHYVGEQFGYDEIKVMHGELVQGHKPPTEILAEHLKAKGFDDLPKDPAEVHELVIWLRAGLRRQAGLEKEEKEAE